MMDKPFAITLDVGSSRANRTGAWRTERPVYVDLTATVQPRLPGRGERPALALPRRGGRLRGGVAADHGGQPVPRGDGSGLLPPVPDGLQPGELDEAVGINSVERFLGDEALRRGWTVAVTAPDPAVTCSSWAPARLASPRHTTCALLGHEVTVRDAGEQAGGMMRYGIPAYRLPRDVLDLEIARIVELGITLELDSRVSDLEREARRSSTPSSSPSAPSWASARTYPPATRRPDPRRARRAARGRRRRAAATRPHGGRLRRRQHRNGCGPDRPATWCDRRGGGLPAHPGPDARPRVRGG